jgi:hypothetical protein
VSIDLSEEYIASIFRVEEISSARKQQASRRQDDNLHNHRCENLKSYTIKIFLTVMQYNKPGFIITAMFSLIIL